MDIRPFENVDPVIPPIFAGRKSEIKYLSDALFMKKESVVVYGNDAIGKSSIISTVYTQMSQYTSNKTFPVKVNAFDFITAIRENFLGVITHTICATIWTKLMNRKYSELIDQSLYNDEKNIITLEEEKTIKRIFRIVTSEKLTGTGKFQSELGGEFFLKGHVKKSNEVINERKSLSHFEFLHLLDELIDIIQSYGYSSIIVFCDELNHFPEDVNTNILRDYFEIFSSNKIQFVIIVVNPDMPYRDVAQKLIETFDCKLELGTFKTIDDVDELIDNSAKLSNNLTFENGCSDFLYNFTDGHPWWIQRICESASKNGKDLIKMENIETSSLSFQKEIDFYRKQIREGRPFRKNHLFHL